MTALGAVQQQGHLRVDEVYDPLSLAVEAAVLRRAITDADGSSRLPLAAHPLIVADVGRLIDAARPRLLAAIGPVIQAASHVAQPIAAPLSPRLTVMLTLPSMRRTALALTTDRASVLRQTGSLVLSGILRELRAAVIAKQVKQYFSPFFAPRRDSGGTVRRSGRSGAVDAWPGQAGMASQHPRLVMLTQSSTAYNETMRTVAGRDDELLRWTLSLQHTDRDLCDEWARVNYGFGPGVYSPEDAPPIPTHPRCRCYFEPAGKRPTFPEEQEAITGRRRAVPLRWRSA